MMLYRAMMVEINAEKPCCARCNGTVEYQRVERLAVSPTTAVRAAPGQSCLALPVARQVRDRTKARDRQVLQATVQRHNTANRCTYIPVAHALMEKRA